MPALVVLVYRRCIEWLLPAADQPVLLPTAQPHSGIGHDVDEEIARDLKLDLFFHFGRRGRFEFSCFPGELSASRFYLEGYRISGVRYG